MVFIFGVNFTESQLVSRALQCVLPNPPPSVPVLAAHRLDTPDHRSFYGIGPNVCKNLMARFSIHKTARVGALRDRQLDDLAAELSTMTLENDLRRQLVDNIKRLRDMGSYRGRRHAMGLPVRGQRTRTQVSFGRAGADGQRRIADMW